MYESMITRVVYEQRCVFMECKLEDMCKQWKAIYGILKQTHPGGRNCSSLSLFFAHMNCV